MSRRVESADPSASTPHEIGAKNRDIDEDDVAPQRKRDAIGESVHVFLLPGDAGVESLYTNRYENVPILESFQKLFLAVENAPGVLERGLASRDAANDHHGHPFDGHSGQGDRVVIEVHWIKRPTI